MHRRLSNLSIQGMTARARSLVTHLMIAALVLPAAPVHAAKPGAPQSGFTAGGLMGLSGFKNLVLTIAMVNKAMRDASENPMDEWRRTNVQVAMGMMPGAIAGMAKHFFNGQLGDADLPGIQAMLGGFVDKNAGDNYKKFLKKPSKDLIPKTGAGFPNVQAPPVPQSGGAGVASTSSKSGGASATGGTVSKPEVDRMPTKEMVSFTQRLEAKTGSDKSVGYDDSAAKGSSGGSSVSSVAASASAGKFSKPEVSSAPEEIFGPTRETASLGGSPQTVQEVTTNRAGLPFVGSETVKEASREMNNLERSAPASSGGISTLTIRRTDNKDKKSDAAADDEFFSNVGQDEVAKNKTKLKKKIERRPATKPTSYRGTSHFLRFFALGLSVMTNEARAEGEEGERSGQNAGMILMGIASIIGAIAPMIIASTQANADKAIAKTNADAQIKMTQISADTQREANNIAKDVALTQSATARDVAVTNNEAVTDRLNLQLAELRSARTEAQQAERERRALDENYNQQRIALAEKQSQQNLDLAKDTLAAQLSEAGLRTGFSTTTNSAGGGLTTTATVAAAGSSANIGSRLTSGGATLSGASTQASTGQGAVSSRSGASLDIGSAKVGSTNQLSARGIASEETASGTNLASRLGVVGSSRGIGAAGEDKPNETFAAEIGKDATTANKIVECRNKFKGNNAKIAECTKEASAPTGSKRGISPVRGRLLKADTLTFNSAAAGSRGIAGRLPDATNSKVGGSTAEMRAFAAKPVEARGANVKGSSFGDFLSGSARNAPAPANDFVNFRARGVASEGSAGGHKANGGIRRLIEE